MGYSPKWDKNSGPIGEKRVFFIRLSGISEEPYLESSKNNVQVKFTCPKASLVLSRHPLQNQVTSPIDKTKAIKLLDIQVTLATKKTENELLN